VSEKPLLLPEVARRDVETAVAYYIGAAGPDVALGFIDVLESVYRTIAERPAVWSPRHARELVLPGLRSLAVKGFPYLAR